MKKLNKILSVGLSLAMCAGMVAPAFAMDITQEYIDGLEKKTSPTLKYDYVELSSEGDDEFNFREDVKTNYTLLFKNGGNDVVVNLNGYTVTKNNDKSNGSVIRVENADLTVNGEGGTITGGKAHVVGDKSNLGSNNGGGIYIENGSLTVNNVTLKDNEAKLNGSAIEAVTTDKTDTVTLNNVTVTDNDVTGTGGGAVRVSGYENVKLDNVQITNNTSGGAGGGLGIQNTTKVELNDVTITGNKSTGVGVNPDQPLDTPLGWGGGIHAASIDEFIMNNVKVNGNKAGSEGSMYGVGGGMYFDNIGKVTMTNTEVKDNFATQYGGAISIVNSTIEMKDNVSVTKNDADWGAGGIFSQNGTIIAGEGTVIANNSAKLFGDDLYLINTDMTLLDPKPMNQKLDSDGKDITGWYWDAGDRWSHGTYAYHKYPNGHYSKLDRTALKAAHGQYFNVIYKDGVGEDNGTQLQASEVENGSKIPGYDNETPTREGYNFIGWRLADSSEVDFEAGVVDGELVLVAQWEEVEPEPTPIVPGDDTDDDTDVTIEDPTIPLAGLFTRADAIGYLWEQTGSPDAELSDFPDVPEDHYWAVAIGWAQDMGIALPDEEGNFRPDDLVLRSSIEPEGELQQFLDRYAVFAGVELAEGQHFYVVAGVSDDIVMGEDAQVIFDEFFAKLEAALAKQAA